MNEAKRLDIKEKAVLLLCRVLLEKDVVSEIKPNRMILLMVFTVLTFLRFILF